MQKIRNVFCLLTTVPGTQIRTCQNSCEGQIEENLATYVGGRDPPWSTPELGPIWRLTLPVEAFPAMYDTKSTDSVWKNVTLPEIPTN